MIVYVLTHEFSDKSGFHVCGVTDSNHVAMTWTRAGDENKVYACDLNGTPAFWLEGLRPWDKEKRKP